MTVDSATAPDGCVIDQGPEQMSTHIAARDESAVDPIPTGRRSAMRRAGEETIYILATFPVAVIAVSLVAALLGIGLGLSILVIGLPILATAPHLARAFAVHKRRMLRRYMRRPAATPMYHRSDGGFIRRATTTLKDPQSWLDVGHTFLGLILSAVTFVLAVDWWAATIGCLGWVLWGWALRLPSDSVSLPDVLGLGDNYLIDLVFYTALGVVLLVLLPWVIRALAWANAGPALIMLSGRANLQREVEYLVKGREAARTAEAGSLRRLERDIHDGPQQRLVRLSMDLGRAKKQIGKDPEMARETLDEAIVQTRQTLDELRALSRGIAPPVLSDRGLQAAMEEIMARSTVPVHLRMDVPQDLPDHVETAAYFVVSEALVNVAKHAMATYALVDLSYERKLLTVKVSDDGVGGAQLAKGHGLVGLADRVRGVDGVLNVTSPPGGPTEVVAEIACGS